MAGRTPNADNPNPLRTRIIPINEPSEGIAYIQPLVRSAALTASQGQSKTPKAKSAQASSGDDKDIHEMLLTEAGLLAFDTPKDWERSNGPGFACFVPKSSDAGTSTVMIYISGAPIGSDQDAKTLVRSDISGFKARFQKGVVHQEEAILLPISKMEVPLYTFKSGEEEHNAIEQVAYIQDTAERVLTVVNWATAWRNTSDRSAAS